MLSVTREKGTGQILVTTTGVLDEAGVEGLLRAVALAPDASSVVIDLAKAQLPDAACLRTLLAGLSHRSGQVLFRGPSWAAALGAIHAAPH
jgi:anti-anti-sigma regulatory factor